MIRAYKIPKNGSWFRYMLFDNKISNKIRYLNINSTKKNNFLHLSNFNIITQE